MASSPLSEPTTPTSASTPAEEPLAPAFIIGIAGPSSCGKTVASLILAKIFKEALAKDADVNINLKLINPSITIFAADDYFLAHEACPKRKFRPRVGDEATVMGHVNEQDQVETSDRDCLAAIDWVRLHNDIKAFKDGTATTTTTEMPSSDSPHQRTTIHQNEVEAYRQAMAALISPADLKRLATKIQDCISDQIMFNMLDKFPGHLFQEASPSVDLLNARIAIVEGFLLFARERPPPALTTPLSPQHATTHLPVPLAGSPKACHEAIATDLLDVRLYIHVTPATQVRRRFSRAAYMDPPRGTRMPGQMWKTLGYFYDIARANFNAYNTLPAGMVRQLVQNGLVEDAVREILHGMKLLEQTARQRFVAERAVQEQEREREEMQLHQEDYNAMVSLMAQTDMS